MAFPLTPAPHQQSQTRLAPSFHLSANESLEPAKQQEGDSSSTVCSQQGLGASTVPAVPVSGCTPCPTAQQDCGARPPESRPSPWVFLLLETQWLARALSGKEVSTPFSETPEQRGCPRRSGKGAQRDRVFTNRGCFSSFRAEDGLPSRPLPLPRPAHETRAPGPRPGEGARSGPLQASVLLL